jgi:hypothetical protein
MRRLPALLCLCAIAAAVATVGCGEGGAASGATVSVYVAAPLCREAQGELRREGGKAGDLRVRAVCLPSTESGGHVDLARTGANARRATEDSTAVAYLEGAGPAARFSETIVESANLAWLSTNSGAMAMRRVLEALAEAGSSSPRDAVREAL